MPVCCYIASIEFRKYWGLQNALVHLKGKSNHKRFNQSLSLSTFSLMRFIHSFSFIKHFILVRVVVQPETIQGTLGNTPGWDTIRHKASFAFLIDTRGNSESPIHLLACFWVVGGISRKPTCIWRGHVKPHTDCNPSSGSNHGLWSSEITKIPDVLMYHPHG